MEELVFLQNEQAITTSLKVAEVFGKEHKNIVRDIRALIKEMASVSQNSNLSDGVNTPMFQETSYQAEEGGRSYPMYLMNRDGFTLLAMGFTGQKALKFKLAYINAFNKMEKALEQLTLKRGVVRQSSIFSNKDLMAAVHDEVIPAARRNGSTTPDKMFYMNFNKLINKNAGVPAGNRDGLPTTQLIMIDQMQNIAAAKIRSDSHKGKTHKEIYGGAKQVIEGYAQVALVAERFLLN